MTYFEGSSVEGDLTACFVVEQREEIHRLVYAAITSLYLRLILHHWYIAVQV